MKFKLITLMCAFAFFKLKLSQAYYLPHDSQYLEPPYASYHHHHLQPQHEDYSVHLKEDFTAQGIGNLEHDFGFDSEAFSYDPHSSDQHLQHHEAHHYQIANEQQYFNDLHLKQLAESAKDPNNLKNGIFHDGAITYDLGLPNYKILNPYDPPEIITANHPQYHEQLNHIKTTNNFTFKDFGTTLAPKMDTIPETTYFHSETTTSSSIFENKYVATTTHRPETTTRATPRVIMESKKILPELLETTPLSDYKITTPLPTQKYENQENEIQKYLSKTKEKLKILNDELDLKNSNHTISLSSTDLKIVFVRLNEDLMKKPKEIPPEDRKEFVANELIQQRLGSYPLQPYDNDSKFEKSFYGQSILLPANPVKTTSYPNELRNNLPSPLFYNPGIAYPLPVPSFSQPYSRYNNDQSQEDFAELQERLYRSPPLQKSESTESSSSTPTESSEGTTTSLPLENES